MSENKQDIFNNQNNANTSGSVPTKDNAHVAQVGAATVTASVLNQGAANVGVPNTSTQTPPRQSGVINDTAAPINATEKTSQKATKKTAKLNFDAKSKKIVTIIACVMAIIAVLLIVYVVKANVYDDRYLPNTEANSVPLAGLTIDEASAAVAKDFSELSVVVAENEKEDFVLTGDYLSLEAIPGELEDVLASQNKWDWLSAALFGGNDYQIGVTYNEEAVLEATDAIIGNNDERIASVNATIAIDEANDKFEAVEASVGTQIDREALANAIKDAIVQGGATIDVSTCYIQPAFFADSEQIAAALDKGNRVINKHIAYNIDMIDDAETLTKDQIISFLTVNDAGELAANEENISIWLREIGSEYDTVGREISYTTAYGKEAYLPTGTWGWITDESGMLPIVVDNLLNDEDTIDQDFVYQQECSVPKDASGFGDKYVDIDLTDQRVRLIENGEVVQDLVTVTGSNDGRHKTPEGAWFINFKSAPYKMVGSDENGDGKPDYETPTECFANFINGCALHEMSSRRNWSPRAWLVGGGSHGCANLKRNDAWTAYNFVDYGTPVLVHM